MSRIWITFALACATLSAAPSAPRGIWDAAVTSRGKDVGFRMEFALQGKAPKAAILDGDRPNWSTSAQFDGSHLTLRWDYFDAILEADLKGGELTGHYARTTRTGRREYPFHAKAFRPSGAAGTKVVVDGAWRLKFENEGAPRVVEGIFRQSGGEVSVTIQEVDGDYGTLSGRVVGNQLTLSHFDGIRATLLEARVAPDGSIEGTLDGGTRFTGVREENAAKLGIPEPPDPSRFTTVRDPSKPFAFRFPDAATGAVVSNTDARFKNKVVIVTILGSWCPNCHDEAPVLVNLYKKYHSQGLEIVALSFEYTGDTERDRQQVQAFARRHAIPYPMLLAGTTNDGDLQKKLPQIVNFGAYPTTFFLGRDGRVRSVHAGFAGPANPKEYARLKEETDKLVRQLLAQAN